MWCQAKQHATALGMVSHRLALLDIRQRWAASPLANAIYVLIRTDAGYRAIAVSVLVRSSKSGLLASLLEMASAEAQHHVDSQASYPGYSKGSKFSASSCRKHAASSAVRVHVAHAVLRHPTD
jgi:hypothetical protein